MVTVSVMEVRRLELFTQSCFSSWTHPLSSEGSAHSSKHSQWQQQQDRLYMRSSINPCQKSMSTAQTDKMRPRRILRTTSNSPQFRLSTQLDRQSRS